MVNIARKGENIRKRKDGRYEARYQAGYKLDGKPLYKSIYAKTYSDAKQKRLQALKTVNTETKTTKAITISDISIDWLSKQKLEVKTTSYAKYYDNVYNHILPHLGKIKVKAINQNTIDEYIKLLHEKGRKDKQGGLSSETIKLIAGTLKQIFKYTKKKYSINTLDFEYIIPKAKSKEVETLNHEEQERLTTYLVNNLDRQNLGLLICLYTGLRIGEICATRNGYIDINKKAIKVKKTLQRIKNVEVNAVTKTIVVIDEPKSDKSIREIPIADFLINKIKQFTGKDSDFILTGSAKRYIEPRTLTNRFKSVLSHLKIKDIKFHALRHTFATNAIESGCDIKTLSELLGHSDVQLTLRIYVHSNYELKKQSIENMIIYCA